MPELTELLRRGGAVVTEKLVREAMHQEKNGAVHKNKFGGVRYCCLEPKCGGAMTPVDARGKESPRVAEHWLTSNAAMAVALDRVRDACVCENPNMQREVRYKDRKSAAGKGKMKQHSVQGIQEREAAGSLLGLIDLPPRTPQTQPRASGRFSSLLTRWRPLCQSPAGTGAPQGSRTPATSTPATNASRVTAAAARVTLATACAASMQKIWEDKTAMCEALQRTLQSNFPSEQLFKNVGGQETRTYPMSVVDGVQQQETVDMLLELGLTIVNVPGDGQCKREAVALVANTLDLDLYPYAENNAGVMVKSDTPYQHSTAQNIAAGQAGYMRSPAGKRFLLGYMCCEVGRADMMMEDRGKRNAGRKKGEKRKRSAVERPLFTEDDIEIDAGRHTTASTDGVVSREWAGVRLDTAALARRTGCVFYVVQVGRDFVLKFTPGLPQTPPTQEIVLSISEFNDSYKEGEGVIVFNCIEDANADEVKYRLLSKGCHFAAAIPTGIAEKIELKRGTCVGGGGEQGGVG